MIINELGLVQIYTGDGKGKTTAALGLALRAVGHGLKVHVVQFMKGSGYAGELATAAKLFPYLQISQFGIGCKYSGLIRQGVRRCIACGDCFVKNRGVTEEDTKIVGEAMDFVKDLFAKQECDILILDEIGNALRYGLVSSEEILKLIKSRPEKMELILTGRGMSDDIIQAADLVTEMKMVKHPYQKGIASRRGIEY